MGKGYGAVRLGLFGLILCLGTLAALLIGEGQSWARADLSGVPVRTLASAADSDLVYAVVDGKQRPAGVYRSRDGGSTWQWAGAGPGGVLQALTASRADAGLVYAATEGTPGLWLSQDGGRTWRRSPLGLPAAPDGHPPAITALAADPSQAGVVYVGSDGQGVYRFDKTAGSYGYQLLGSLALFNAHVKGVVIGPEGRVYALTADGLYATHAADGELDQGKIADEAGGVAWEKLATPELLASLAVAPGDGRRLYAGGVSTGVYRSTDGGQTWERAGVGLDMPPGVALRVVALAVDGQNGRHVAAATAYGLGRQFAPGGVYESRDGGFSWTRLAETGQVVTQLNFQRGALYAATPGGLVRLGPAGESELRAGLASEPSAGPASRLSVGLRQPSGIQVLILALSAALAGLALVGRREWIGG